MRALQMGRSYYINNPVCFNENGFRYQLATLLHLGMAALISPIRKRLMMDSPNRFSTSAGKACAEEGNFNSSNHRCTRAANSKECSPLQDSSARGSRSSGSFASPTNAIDSPRGFSKESRSRKMCSPTMAKPKVNRLAHRDS